MDDGDFSTKSDAFLTWLQQIGTTISSKIQLADLRSRHAGRGVLATADIAEDEELFTVPRSSILTAEASSLPAEIKEQFDDQWLSLMAAMIYEYQRGSDSTWKAYFDVLPASFNTLMFWSEEELECLESSAVVKKIGKSSANESFKAKILPILQQHTDIFKTTGMSDDQLLALCHRMGSTIMAYAFDLEKPGSGSTAPRNEEDGWEEDEEETELLPKGMVPLADMLNADADRNNAKLFYEDDKVVMKSITVIKAGDEVFNDYGPLPTADVLRRYGYTTHNYAKCDVVEISLDLIKQMAAEGVKLKGPDLGERTSYLDEHGILEDGYDISHASSDPESPQFPDELCILLNTLLLPKADFDKMKQNDKLQKPALILESVRLLYTIIVRRRAEYTFNALDDGFNSLQLNAAPIDISSASHRQKQARLVVAGEKKVLQEAAAALQKMLLGTGDGNKKRKAPTDTFEEEAKAVRAQRSNGEHPSKKTKH
ncbi:hypothetical protein LTR08_005967 [Meristemomyces frigidus]|nr:hypothetical protein LTR08_005967 [Meristemomyces frigidus]